MKNKSVYFIKDKEAMNLAFFDQIAIDGPKVYISLQKGF